MLFSLFCNTDRLGEVRFGLASSDIIDCTDLARLLMPLAIYTFLGNPTALPSYPRQPLAIPAVPTPAIQDFRS